MKRGMNWLAAMRRGALLLVIMAAASCTGPWSRESEDTGEMRALASQGDTETQYRLALRYQTGRGVAQDYAAAATWFGEAAERGHAGAQFFLGVAFATGRGTEQDRAQAAEWYTRAAEQGHARAQYQLGDAFSNSRGVAKDHAWAARWFGKAARQGHTEAQFSLGVVNASAQGVPRNDAEGYKWLGLATAEGHELAARVRDAVAKKLTPERISQIDAAVESWAPDTDTAYADEPTVRYVQDALSRLGYDAGAVDGAVSERTRSAIQAYQREAGLAADGAVSETLVERLRVPDGAANP